LVGAAIRSVLTQSLSDLELIVIDDASTDATSDVAASVGDSRIRLMRLESQVGAGGARNRGAAVAIAPLIAFQDSDDEWLPGRLQLTVEALEEAGNGAALAYSDMIRVDGDSEQVFRAPTAPGRRRLGLGEALRFGVGNIGVQSTVIRAESLAACGGFDEGLPALEDFELFVRLAQIGRFVHVRRPLVRFHPQTDGLSLNFRAVLAAWRMIAEKYGGPAAGGAVTRAYFLSQIGRHLHACGDVEDGLRQVLAAARLAPVSLVGVRALAYWLRWRRALSPWLTAPDRLIERLRIGRGG